MLHQDNKTLYCGWTKTMPITLVFMQAGGDGIKSGRPFLLSASVPAGRIKPSKLLNIIFCTIFIFGSGQTERRMPRLHKYLFVSGNYNGRHHNTNKLTNDTTERQNNNCK